LSFNEYPNESIVQAFWGWFNLPPLSSYDAVSCAQHKPLCGRERALVIILQSFLKVVFDTGLSYMVSMPFLAKKAWPLRAGILMERKLTLLELEGGKPEDKLTQLYYLQHPLDEIQGVIYLTANAKQAKKPNLKHISPTTHDIINVETLRLGKSVLIVFNRVTKNHELWECYVDDNGGIGETAKLDTRTRYDAEIENTANDLTKTSFDERDDFVLSSSSPSLKLKRMWCDE
jgi:hypothetical protein